VSATVRGQQRQDPVISVGAGQVEAIRSLGTTQRGCGASFCPKQCGSRCRLGNELIGLLKSTSLASVISLTELMEQTNLIASRNFHVIPLLMVAALW